MTNILNQINRFEFTLYSFVIRGYKEYVLQTFITGSEWNGEGLSLSREISSAIITICNKLRVSFYGSLRWVWYIACSAIYCLVIKKTFPFLIYLGRTKDDCLYFTTMCCVVKKLTLIIIQQIKILQKQSQRNININKQTISIYHPTSSWMEPTLF